MVPATITGWARRFWQGSPDHRGTPTAPGRVVTLVSQPGASCMGVCFEIAPEHLDEALKRLDHREKAGYERHLVNARTADGEIIRDAITYVAAEGNEDYLGPATYSEMAAQIVKSVGPSGTNLEYVMALHESLLKLGANDTHLRTLATHVEELTGNLR